MRKNSCYIKYDWLNIFSRANQISCNISNPHLTSLWERSVIEAPINKLRTFENDAQESVNINIDAYVVDTDHSTLNIA